MEVETQQDEAVYDFQKLLFFQMKQTTQDQALKLLKLFGDC